jgi:hypothetical protein
MHEITGDPEGAERYMQQEMDALRALLPFLLGGMGPGEGVLQASPADRSLALYRALRAADPDVEQLQLTALQWDSVCRVAHDRCVGAAMTLQAQPLGLIEQGEHSAALVVGMEDLADMPPAVWAAYQRKAHEALAERIAEEGRA